MRIISKAERLLDTYREAKDRAERAAQELKLAEEELKEEMVLKQRKSISKVEGDKKIKVTYVAGERTNLNEDGLKKQLGQARWRKYTKVIADKAKIEAAMETGELDPLVVGQHVTVVPITPYLKLTIGKAEDSD